MKKAVILAVIIAALSLLMGCATMKAYDTKVSYSGTPTVVIIGGAGSTNEQLKPLHNALPGSIVVIPEKYYPLSGAADAILQQIRKAGVSGSFVAVGYSWGALIAHQMNGMYKGLVVAIVAIATPLDITYVPHLPGTPFHPDVIGPLYVIAGVKPGAPQKWYMTNPESDGVVDLDEANGFGKRELKGFAVIKGENAGHWEIVQNPEAIGQVKAWLETPAM